jgi:hypothetical protein
MLAANNAPPKHFAKEHMVLAHTTELHAKMWDGKKLCFCWMMLVLFTLLFFYTQKLYILSRINYVCATSNVA